MNGAVIGVNSAIISGSQGNDGIGFAIPMNLASNVATMLIKDGKVHYARIGVALAAMTPALARQLGLDENIKGVLIENVVSGSPAEKAGLKEGDIVVGFAGEKVLNRSSFRLKVATSEVAKPYEIVFLREGKERTATIVPAPYDKVVFDQERDRPQTAEGEKSTSIGDFGLEVQPLTSDLSKSMSLPADLKGLLVSSVKDGSAAEAAGVQEGDVITKIVRDRKIQPVTTVKDFQDVASKSSEIAVHSRNGSRELKPMCHEFGAKSENLSERRSQIVFALLRKRSRSAVSAGDRGRLRGERRIRSCRKSGWFCGWH